MADPTPDIELKLNGQPVTPPNAGDPQPAGDPPPAKKYAGKYDTVEDLEKSYAELQAQFTKLSQQQKPGDQTPPNDQQPKKDDPPPADDPQKKDDQPPANEPQKGVDFAALEEEYTRTHALSTESREKLHAQGITDAVIDRYIAGVEALAKQMNANIYTLAGGENSYNEMVQWAGQSLSQEQAAAFNSTLDKGTPAEVELAVRGLYAQFRAANPKAPDPILGDTVAPTAGSFGSMEALVAAMKDARYASDPAYRNEVQQKLARSTF